VDAFTCYKQKCKVVSLNLAHPVYISEIQNTGLVTKDHQYEMAYMRYQMVA